jgi:hypothetical protein
MLQNIDYNRRVETIGDSRHDVRMSVLGLQWKLNPVRKGRLKRVGANHSVKVALTNVIGRVLRVAGVQVDFNNSALAPHARVALCGNLDELLAALVLADVHFLLGDVSLEDTTVPARTTTTSGRRHDEDRECTWRISLVVVFGIMLSQRWPRDCATILASKPMYNQQGHVIEEKFRMIINSERPGSAA